MPIVLTTPKVCGDLDPNTPRYGEVKILQTIIDIGARVITLRVGYGNTIGGIWLPSTFLPDMSFSVKGEAFQTLTGTLPVGDGTLYEQVSKTLYQWLLDEAHFAGTIAT